MKDRNKPSVRELIFNKYNGHCAYCGCQISRDKFHIDHIVPIRRGTKDYQLKNNIRGTNEIENYNPACISCNSSKNELSIEAWRIELSLKVNRLNRDISNYRLMKRFGLIIEISKPIKFYFEEVNHG